ncbi:SDR family NAD(P)-dependent oxidoreductase [Pantoea sp.]|uniref:SDR family NAD(P)-dependent oxidoreductase n=1 Tax=Pantoea sp. TaxID=69393 RepID=UPI00289EEEF1|nr:SDR family NAD(P)-dependent oxidoreductase [Pantoea sp.]
MSRIFITGSSDGLGLAAARNLSADGHEVVLHVRNRERLSAVQDLLDKGVQAVIGDLSDIEETKAIAARLQSSGRMDAIIHNAGIYNGQKVLPVNVVAPYILTALVERPSRLIYLSSGMHLSGRPLLEGLDWSGQRETASYSDTKLFVTALAAAVARFWPSVIVSAVDPGWVPTKMGGAGAPDDLRLGHLTQEWLAVSDDPETQVSGGYWHHQQRRAPHAAVHDEAFQNALLNALEQTTGIALPV